MAPKDLRKTLSIAERSLLLGSAKLFLSKTDNILIFASEPNLKAAEYLPGRCKTLAGLIMGLRQFHANIIYHHNCIVFALFQNHERNAEVVRFYNEFSGLIDDDFEKVSSLLSQAHNDSEESGANQEALAKIRTAIKLLNLHSDRALRCSIRFEEETLSYFNDAIRFQTGPTTLIL